jgi:septum formation topological specificity factor MinE
MKSIGIRTTPKEVFFTVIEQNEDENEIKVTDKLVLPVSMNVPDKLNFVRKTIIDIINQYNINKAGIKITEGNAQRLSIERISIEAVIQELFSGCSIKNYFGGNISKISKLLGLPNNGVFKKIIKGDEIPDELEFLTDMSEYHKESTLAALAALNL